MFIRAEETPKVSGTCISDAAFSVPMLHSSNHVPSVKPDVIKMLKWTNPIDP